MHLRIDDLNGPEIAKLLNEHMNDMKLVSPPESNHALILDELRKPEITFWTAWSADQLAGCGALLELNNKHGEVKSMRTAPNFRRKGIGAMVLQNIIAVAKNRNYERLSLETGSMEYFKPARELYTSFGFHLCEPFATYIEDSNSVFMSMDLENRSLRLFSGADPK